MISAAFVTNGNVTNTPIRARSAPIKSRFRDRRSISGPAVRPTTTDGRKIAIHIPLTHQVEPVLFLTSWASAIVAIQVPRPEPSVANHKSR